MVKHYKGITLMNFFIRNKFLSDEDFQEELDLSGIIRKFDR